MNRFVVSVVLLSTVLATRPGLCAENCPEVKRKNTTSAVTLKGVMGLQAFGQSKFKLSFSKEGDNYYLVAMYEKNWKSPLIVTGPDTPLMVTLEDGSELTFKPACEATAKRTFYGIATNRKVIETLYGARLQDIEKMATSDITVVKFSFKVEGKIDSHQYSVKSWQAKGLKRYAKKVAPET